MKPTVEMIDGKKAMVLSILGASCCVACTVLMAVPLLREVALAAIAKAFGGVLAITVVSVARTIREIAQEPSLPVWLRILGGAATVSTGVLLLVVQGVMGGWFLLAVALFFVVGLFAWVLPKAPTPTECNRG